MKETPTNKRSVLRKRGTTYEKFKKGSSNRRQGSKGTIKESGENDYTVLRIINRYKKGVGTATLMEKTGYNQKKIANIVFKLKTQGKITSVGMGVYVKA